MRVRAISTLGTLTLAGTLACVSTWKNSVGTVPLEPTLFSRTGSTEDASDISSSRRLSFTLPNGWHWYLRGDDLIATRDGVFLQQILVERLHVDMADQDVGGTGAWSSNAWPVRTAKNLKQRFVATKPPADAAEVLLASRRNDPNVTDLTVHKIVTRTIAGQQAFKALFDFRVKSEIVDPSPLYRSAYCGFVLGDWFYGISYTATARYYFDRDIGSFETFLESVRLEDE